MERNQVRAETETLIPNLGECAARLRQWHGARARIWRYHASLSRLAICLIPKGPSAPVYLLASTCEFIRGPFSWDNNAMEILIDSERSIRVIDESAGFELVCNSVSMWEDVIGEFEFDQ